MGRAVGVARFGLLGVALALGAAGLVAACGGSSVSPETAASDASAEGSASDGGAITLDNVCAQTPAKVCELRKPCCEKTAGFDEAACLKRAANECERNVAEVKAGRMTFDPSRIDACLERIRPIVAQCFLVIDDYTRVAQAFHGCRVFSGDLGEGAICDRDDQCRPSATPDAFVGCEKGKCHTTRLLPAGAACEIKDGADGACGSGLYCALPLSDAGAIASLKGSCKTALALGVDCTGAHPLACGLGNYCDDVTKKCTPGKAGEASCTGDLQCATVTCRKDKDAGSGDAGAAGTCKPQEPIVKANECGK